MKLLLLLSSLLIIASPNANARILQGNKYDMVISIYGRPPPICPPSSSSSSSSLGIINSAGRETFDMISSVSGRQPPPNRPPSPIPSPSHNPSTRGSSSGPCDHDTTKNYNNKIKWRISDITIRSPPPPINSAGSDEFDMISSVCGREGQPPPPPPQSSTPIHTLGMRRTPPALICMPGKPCTDEFIIVSS